MSDPRGREVFEGPSEQELSDYIKKGRQSIQRMKSGRPPLFFKPKERYPRFILIMIILLILPSSLILLSTISNLNTGAVESITIKIQSPSGAISGTELVEISLTGNAEHYWYYIDDVDSVNQTWETDISRTLPDGTYTLHAYGNDSVGNVDHKVLTFTVSTTTTESNGNTDLSTSVNGLEISINNLIGSNYSIINTIIIDGTVNTSQVINFTELLDLIWILSQFEEQSSQWDLGRTLLFEYYPFWNSSSIDTEEFPVQLKALRSLLAYPGDKLPIITEELEVFQNKSEFLWNITKTKCDVQTNTITEPFNDSSRMMSYQIELLEVIANAASHPFLFSLTELHSYANNILETIDQLTNITNGVSDQFSTNFSWTSHIYKCKHQGELLIALDRIGDVLAVRGICTRIQNRLNSFINGFLSSGKGTFYASYNTMTLEHSSETNIMDQALIARSNVILKFPTSAENAVEGLADTLSDKSTFHLLDQLQSLLALQEFIAYESSRHYYPTGGQASFWGIEILLLGLIAYTVKQIVVKKKKKK